MLSAVMATAVSTPLAIVLYDPSRRYTMYKRRTVQHHRPDTELRILTCIHDQSHVPAAIELLEAANATEASPLAVYALHLVELVGAAAPLFIPHKLSRSNSNSNSSPSFPTHHHHVPYSDHIINAFILHEQRHPGIVSVHPFTTISPYASMHDEVCRMVLQKRTSFLVLPFHKKQIPGGGGGVEVNSRLRAVNRSVVKLAPCSIGVLVDAGIGMAMRTPGPKDKFIFRVGVFFLGGSDDREALSLASRMVRHPGVSLTIMRFLPSRSIRDNPAERKLDVTLVEQFRQESRGEKRVAYRESLVKDMVQIVEVIRAMDDGSYDLFMVGMRHRVNTVVSEGVMMEWNDCPELGVVGNFLASSAFVGRHAVLVVKQQDLLS